MGRSPMRATGGMTRRGMILAAFATAAVTRSGVARQLPPAFGGRHAGEERETETVKLCWCPPGRFVMGSPPGEPERRPGEDQVDVTLTRGFWMAKYEATQGQWKRIVGELPGPLTAELPAGDDLPVGNVNFAETEVFCRKLTERGRQSGRAPEGLGVPPANRSAVGIRVPRRNDDRHGVWRHAQQQAGELQGQAVQRRQSRGLHSIVPRESAATRPTRGGCTTCTATPSSGAAIGTTRGCRAARTLICMPRRAPATRSEHGDISRVRRGGCWADEGWPCRSAFRVRFEAERRYDHIGFRVVAVPL